ncbi:transglutaminase-like putative cysteine protease [Roseiarcus fermentans]|uniref:Transglutaminase-like putative cysteine protease n=1 Tax=Roseiarcus fermentans TaxID=1473586 RepID=A0A366FBY5_9HYPH|nr:transglutaminase family protein [Roseiarcus fermentans]RBP12183.1 transglutaminase-like putative cysteine protease [Roseiarcus fermentans]
MRIRISHETTHRYAPPARMLIQNLRLTPHGFDSQYLLFWRVALDIDSAIKTSEDAHGNVVSTFSHHGAPIERLTVTARGEVETSDSAGVIRGTAERLPTDMYLRDSPLAHVNGALRAFAIESAGGAQDPLDALHRLMAELHRVMSFDPYQTDDPDSAAEAFALRRGRARDFANIFIACARALGAPARFVTGYRAFEEPDGEAGAHAWAEAHVPRLGWVAFDPTVCICADPGYVRVVVGFDARDASFASAAHGMSDDTIESVIRVEQARFQTQS